MKIKNRIIVWILIPIVISSITFLFIYKKPYYLIGNEASSTFKNISIRIISDQTENGNSEIKLLETKHNSLKYSYTLKEGATWKYANLLLFPIRNPSINLKSYDYVKVKMKASKGIRIPLIISAKSKLKDKDEGVTIDEDLFFNLNVSDSLETYNVPFSKMTPPDWWYISRNLKETDLEKPDLSNVTRIAIASCLNIPLNATDQVVIEEISFHFDYITFITYAGALNFIYYLIFAFFYYNNKRKSPSVLKINYEKVEARSHQAKEEELIFSFIHQNYSNPDLAITDIQDETGIHERKVSTIVKNKSGVSFKTYLNNLRISEAKILLSRTDLPISEIAFNVGYGNASHFNRVFKSNENCSPNDFRKKSP
jgi:AraC-like DNA-binding protein